MRKHSVTSADGTTLHVRDWGPEDAPAILLLHGWSQHHLSWSKQTDSELTEEFRLIAPDLRGHGASDKPDDPAAYDNSAPWAGDVAAIIEALGLVNPLLVGWSMGGWVVCDYLRVHGDDAIAGIVLVGSTARTGPGSNPDQTRKHRPDVRAEGMYSDDLPTNLNATIAFVRACFAAPLSKQDLALMVGFNMLCPPHVRKAARLRVDDYRRELGAFTKPAMVLFGAAERICLPAMADELRAALPGAVCNTYLGVSHAPFWETPARFNDDLAVFARTVWEGRHDDAA